MAYVGLGTKLSRWIHSWSLPDWAKRFLWILQEVVIIPTLKVVGEVAIDFIKETIYEQANLDISGKEKFNNVFVAFRSEFTSINITDHLLDTLIQTIYSTMKKDDEV